MSEQEKEKVIQTIQTIIIAIDDGSIISNAEDYVKMVEKMFDK